MPKAKKTTINVMLSSRNLDRIPDGNGGAVTLEEVRRELEEAIEGETLWEEPAFEVFINEAAGHEDGTADVWDRCMEEVDESDVVVVIYNGHAGWSKRPGDMGICHAEMQRAQWLSPSKLRLIPLAFPSDPALGLVSPDERVAADERNQRFQKAIETANLFGKPVPDAPALKAAVELAVAKAVVDLVSVGSSEGRRGRYHLGAPLDWSQLGYRERKQRIEAALRQYLLRSREAEEGPGGLTVGLAGGARVLFLLHGVPSGFGIAEARELVGRPYLRDHAVAWAEADVAGPVHVIACHKSCTESQVISFMGHPDLYIVQAEFGFFVADQISFVQTFFLTGCRDEGSTRFALQRMFDWIEQAGEDDRIVARGRSRRRILEAVVRELDRAPQAPAIPVAGGRGAAGRGRRRT